MSVIQWRKHNPIAPLTSTPQYGAARETKHESL